MLFQNNWFSQNDVRKKDARQTTSFTCYLDVSSYYIVCNAAYLIPTMCLKRQVRSKYHHIDRSFTAMLSNYKRVCGSIWAVGLSWQQRLGLHYGQIYTSSIAFRHLLPLHAVNQSLEFGPDWENTPKFRPMWGNKSKISLRRTQCLIYN